LNYTSCFSSAPQETLRPSNSNNLTIT
jgi:hypothetical protein